MLTSFYISSAFSIFFFLTYFESTNDPMVVYKRTDKWYIEWQRMTTSGTACGNEWQRVATSVTTSDNEWQRMVNEWQQMTTSDNE